VKPAAHDRIHTAPTGRRDGRWRQVLFRFAAVCLGLVPLLLLELTLHWAGIPDETARHDPLVDLHQLEPLFVPCETEGEAEDALEIAAWRMDYFRPARFQRVKPPGEFRIFVLGGSTVQGRPYATETAFSSWLELSLHAADPSRRWNVINCGGVSYASYRVAAILDEVLAYEPDLLILYTGHNEFLEDRTYAGWRQIPRWAARLSQPVSDLHTTRLLGRVLRRAVGNEPAPRWVASREVDARLDHVGGLESYRRDPAWRSGVIGHFRDSLDRCLRAANEAEVPLVLCVPVSNLRDTPPFKVAPPADSPPEQQAELRDAWEQIKRAAEPRRREQLARRLLEVDPRHAGAAFALGRLAVDGGRWREAAEWLTVARDRDVCPLRATTEIVAAVRQLGKQHEVLLVDVERRCEQMAAHGLVGDALLVDHVHPSVAVHQEIAGWIFEAIEDAGWVVRGEGYQERRQQLYSEQLAGLGEEYYQRGRQRLVGLRRWAAGRVGEITSEP
jgi:hypothetical protein